MAESPAVLREPVAVRPGSQTHLNTMVLGIAYAIAGFHHGFFEALQGATQGLTWGVVTGVFVTVLLLFVPPGYRAAGIEPGWFLVLEGHAAVLRAP